MPRPVFIYDQSHASSVVFDELPVQAQFARHFLFFDKVTGEVYTEAILMHALKGPSVFFSVGLEEQGILPGWGTVAFLYGKKVIPDVCLPERFDSRKLEELGYCFREGWVKFRQDGVHFLASVHRFTFGCSRASARPSCPPASRRGWGVPCQGGRSPEGLPLDVGGKARPLDLIR